MAAINSPVPPPIPLDIRKELVNPLTPWEVSQELFDQLEPPAPNALYKKVQILPDNKEWRFIWRYFHHLKPVHYTIKRVHLIHERHQQKAFEINLSSIEREATTFPPTWDQEIRADLRTQAIQRWKEAAQIFSPFKTREADGRIRTWTHTKVIPLWHGTNAPICDSICTSGFVYFGKKTIPGAAGAPFKSTDDGYFGSGIYFTNSARYAADIYSKGHLLLGWVSMREPFPVVGDPKQTDMATLRGGGAYKTYNAHYVPVAPLDPGDPGCAEYHPVQADQTPTCDEYVVFHKSQALPQYWVELEVELPYIAALNKTPRFASELIPYLMKILEHPQVDDDLKLRNFLNKHLSLLFNLPPDEDISVEQAALYEQITQILTPQGINKQLRNLMVGAAFPQPALPVQNLPAQEEKEPPHAGGEKHQVEPQPIAKPEAAKPSLAEKMNMLLAIQKDWKSLEHASKELKGDREIIFAAVQIYGRLLQHASEELKGDREIVLAAVKGYGDALEYASEELKGDREIVLAAVQNYAFALKYASEELKGDRKIVLAAVQTCGGALQHASEELKGDRKIVLAAIQQSGVNGFMFASEQLKGDREIVLAAVRRDGHALKYASEELKGDREIVLAAVRKVGREIINASKELRGDREIVLAAVRQDASAIIYASAQLQADKEIRRAAGDICILS